MTATEFSRAALPEPGTIEYGNLAQSGSAPPLPARSDATTADSIATEDDIAAEDLVVPQTAPATIWPPRPRPGRPLPLPGSPSGLGLRKFRDRLSIPPMIRAWRRPSEVPVRIRAEVARVRLHADLPEVDAWTYEGSMPGPTIEVLSGRPVRIDWENRLGTAEHPAHLPFDVVRVPPLDLPPGVFNADFATTMTKGGRSLSRGPGADSFPPLPNTEAVTAATVVHLHGALTDGHNDGWAHNVTLPGRVTRCTYTNKQESATLWYHDHAMAVTRFNVYAGLAGFYLIRDEQEARLGLPSGDREIPLAITDRNLETELVPISAPRFTGRPLYKQAGFSFAPTQIGEIPVTGPYTLVNGTIWPSLRAEPAWYRFRLLNSTSSRTLRLALHDTTDEVLTPGTEVGPDKPAFTANRLRDAIVVIGTDGGLLPAPVVAEDGVVEMGPGERMDVLVDLGRFRGRTLELRNELGTALNAQDGQADATAMQIVVSRHGGPDRWKLPKTLSRSYRRYKHNDDGSLEIGDERIETHDHAWVALIPPGTRGSLHPELWELAELDPHTPPENLPTTDLIEMTNPDGSIRRLHAVAKLFDDPTTVFIAEGRWAVWHLINLGGPEHPMHIHMTEFQMIARRQFPLNRPGGNVPEYDTATGRTKTPLPVPSPGRPIDPVTAGMKDTWLVKPGEWVSVLGHFGGATGSFMYHCHILDHEDHTMMRPFVVLPQSLLAFHRGHGGGHH